MNKKILVFTVRALGVLVVLVSAEVFLMYKDFVKTSIEENPKDFPAFAKKEMEVKFEKTVEFSKQEIKKAKAMLEKALDNIGEINFPELIIHDM